MFLKRAMPSSNVVLTGVVALTFIGVTLIIFVAWTKPLEQDEEEDKISSEIRVIRSALPKNFSSRHNQAQKNRPTKKKNRNKRKTSSGPVDKPKRISKMKKMKLRVDSLMKRVAALETNRNRIGITTRLAGSTRPNFYIDPNYGLFFIWSVSSDRGHSLGFKYSFAPNHAGRRIYGIKVEYGGTYIIYSQVMVSGWKGGRTSHVGCAQQTIRIRDGIPVVLLSSAVTQHMDDPIIDKPMETIFQMGVFKFHRGDELRVNRTRNCDNTVYDLRKPNSYFGITKISN